jgi:hypothetical protein
MMGKSALPPNEAQFSQECTKMTLFKGENPYIYGLHDSGGEHLMIVNGEPKGWVLVTEAIGTEAYERGGGDYQTISDQGLGVIVRLNQSYGPNGTIPRDARYPEFAKRCANFVQDSHGAHIWVIGNEMNFEREQPRNEDGTQAEAITPRRYATCYKMVRERIKSVPGHEDDLVVVGAIGPWNAQTPYDADPEGQYPANKIPGAPNEYPYFGYFGDYIKYWHDILVAIGPENCDAMAIHAYSHGYRPEMVFDETKMGPPFDKYHYNFFTYKDQMNVIPENMRHLPVYLTEMNGDREGGPHGPAWPFGNNGWVKNAYQEINRWNKSGNQQIRCAILFRWKIDPLGWSIEGKSGVQQDFVEAIARDYKWNPQATVPLTKPEAEALAVVETSSSPEKTAYKATYQRHSTPSQVQPGETVLVKVLVQNSGSVRWRRAGSRPFRLGFQWYNRAGQYLAFPANLDFKTPLPLDVAPGAQVELQARLRTPDSPGNYQLRWDMIQEPADWFSRQGDPGLVVPITVTPGTVSPAAIAATTKIAPSSAGGQSPVTIDAEDISSDLAQHPSKKYPMRTHAGIKRIIIHHTATPATVSVQRIADFQVRNRDLPGIAYHFCVTGQGEAFQTQYLETVADHAGQHSADSVGICLIGNFTSAPPPRVQQDTAAVLLAQLALHLGLSVDQITGYSEVVSTGSPGATWPQWKRPLLRQIARLMQSGKPITSPVIRVPRSGPAKTIEHYMLFWHKSSQEWAEWELVGAMAYIAQFKPVIGFSIDEAKQATYVTIVGDTNGVPATAERILSSFGCKVERIAGVTEDETRRILKEMAVQNIRFKTFT